MRTARLTVSSSSHPDAAYEAIARFEEYPKFVEDISSITVWRDDSVSAFPDTTYSDWEVMFRSGPLRWTEVDYHKPDERQIAFEQHTGDFEEFRGCWQVTATEFGSQVSFEVTFDFGIPSLAGVLEPIADRVLKESILKIMSRTLSDVNVVDTHNGRNAAASGVQASAVITDRYSRSIAAA
jgi:ribosome-associated toxin RatA of RatAB toxin-antitoxin module